MRSLIAALLAVILLPLLATPVLADGGFIASDPAEDIYQPSQKAIIVHQDGREDLVLQVRYEGDVEEFAWIVPVPDYPDVDVSPPELFEELAYFTAVEAYDGGGGLFACLPAGGASKESHVDVWEEDSIGIYDYAILSTTDPQALVEWLNAHGYPFPHDGEEAIDHYVDKEWYFVAVRIHPGEEAEGLAQGTVQPLRLGFDSRDIVYPLKITSLSSDRCDVLLYVFADDDVLPVEYDHLTLNRAEQVIDMERVDEVFYVECSGQVCLGNSTYSFCEPFLAQAYYGYELTSFSGLLQGDEYCLTKMRASIGADSMVDMELIPRGATHYLDTDKDGWSDGEEAIAGTDHRKTDTDGDGDPDPQDPYPLQSSSGPCFIATAAHGSSLDSRVEALCRFRDTFLLTNPAGQSLTSLYYRTSPPVARFIDDHPEVKPAVRIALLPLVALSAVAMDITLMSAIAVAGAVGVVSFALAVWLRRRALGRK
ncbi:MAG: DUF2330 domain-containing protein [Chloroflexota bacterium]